MQNYSRQLPLYLLLIFAFLLGVFTLTDFGESWDEWQFYKYADRALESYATWLQRGEVKITGNTFDNYGPAFVIAAQEIARFLHLFNSNWLVSDLRHLVVFMGYLGGAAAFYTLALRWMNKTAALGACLLFISQPLLWGHAFISPKDIPFMSFFLISVALGMRMVDTKPMLEGSPPRSLLWTIGLWILSLIFLFVTPYLLDNSLAAVIRGASVDPNHPFGSLIRLIAQDFDQVPSETYVTKMRVALIWGKLIYGLLTFIALAWLVRKEYPAALSLFRPASLLAALALGLTCSTRILGPLAGIIIVYYGFRSMGRRALPMLAIYSGIAFIVMLVTWPYLWANPPARLMESLRVMSTYPWEGSTLFKGVYYTSTTLPLDYLPLLTFLQFSLPVWLLCIPGVILLRKSIDLLATTSIWFVLPMVAMTLMHAPLYDNTRQVFFIYPPLFLVAGLGLEWLLTSLSSIGVLRGRWMANQFIQAGLIGVVLIPGLWAGYKLHPYEYVYYNAMAGDPTGKYELEYWATSFREAANWLNEHAAAGSPVVLGVPSHIAGNYLRPDLKQLPIGDFLDHPVEYDYSLLSTRHDNHKVFLMDDPVVYQIERNHLLFSVIKQHIQ